MGQQYYGENGVISIGVNARVVFMNNFGLYTGGAICHKTGTITFELVLNQVLHLHTIFMMVEQFHSAMEN